MIKDSSINTKLAKAQGLIQYGIMYQKHIRGEQIMATIHLDTVANNLNIETEIREYIELFCKLDKEFKEYYGNVNADEWNRNIKKYKKYATWQGFWLGVVGNELSLFLNWLKNCIRDDIINIEERYLYENRSMNAKHVPYSVKIAQKVYLEYFK